MGIGSWHFYLTWIILTANHTVEINVPTAIQCMPLTNLHMLSVFVWMSSIVLFITQNQTLIVFLASAVLLYEDMSTWTSYLVGLHDI